MSFASPNKAGEVDTVAIPFSLQVRQLAERTKAGTLCCQDHTESCPERGLSHWHRGHEGERQIAAR